MKSRILLPLFLALASVFSFGQIDIPIGQVGPIIDLGRGLNWAGSGQGNLNNNFIISNAGNTAQGWCLYLTNNSGGSRTASVQTFSTGDRAVPGFQLFQNRWQIVNTVPGIIGQPYSLTVGAAFPSATVSIFVPASAAGSFDVTFSSGSGAGTVDVFLVSTVATSCGGNPQILWSSSGATPEIQCDAVSGPTGVAAGASTNVLGGAAGKQIYVCEVMVSQPTAPTTPAVSFLETSTSAGSCTGVSPVLPIGGLTVGTVSVGPSAGYLFKTPALGLCYVNNNTGGGTVQVQFTYAFF